MTFQFAKSLIAFAAVASGTANTPDKLVLNFSVNPAADGTAEACVFVEALAFDRHDIIAFQPSPKFVASACDHFLSLRRKMLRPGDAGSFETRPAQALWLKSDPDISQPVPWAAM
jgi:hypothetical protein